MIMSQIVQGGEGGNYNIHRKSPPLLCTSSAIQKSEVAGLQQMEILKKLFFSLKRVARRSLQDGRGRYCSHDTS